MRLTNSIRDAFVTSVMDDVPKEDYKERAEKIFREAAVDCLPPTIKACYQGAHKDYVVSYFLNLAYNPYREQTTYRFPNVHNLVSTINLPGLMNTLVLNTYQQEELKTLIASNEAQSKKRTELYAKLRSIVYGATTVKQLGELLPEFKKYLPTIQEPSRNTPVVINVVSDFLQAGWPKDKFNKNKPA